MSHRGECSLKAICLIYNKLLRYLLAKSNWKMIYSTRDRHLGSGIIVLPMCKYLPRLLNFCPWGREFFYTRVTLFSSYSLWVSRRANFISPLLVTCSIKSGCWVPNCVVRLRACLLHAHFLNPFEARWVCLSMTKF